MLQICNNLFFNFLFMINYFATWSGASVQTAVNSLTGQGFELSLNGFYSLAMLLLSVIQANFALILGTAAVTWAMYFLISKWYRKFSSKGKAKLPS